MQSKVMDEENEDLVSDGIAVGVAEGSTMQYGRKSAGRLQPLSRKHDPEQSESGFGGRDGVCPIFLE